MKEIILGEIVKPHGLNGAVKVKSYADSPDSFITPRQLFLLSTDGHRRDVSILRASPMGKMVTLTIEGVCSRQQAEDLVGHRVVVNREDLPEVEEGEFYWDDLLGMEVYDTIGIYYGIIISILPTGSNDVFVVEGKRGKEILIPGTFDAIVEVNVPERKMVIEPLSGSVIDDMH